MYFNKLNSRKKIDNKFLKNNNILVFQLCYGIIYGMGATSLSKELGIQKQHAQQLIISFFQQFPSES